LRFAKVYHPGLNFPPKKKIIIMMKRRKIIT